MSISKTVGWCVVLQLVTAVRKCFSNVWVSASSEIFGQFFAVFPAVTRVVPALWEVEVMIGLLSESLSEGIMYTMCGGTGTGDICLGEGEDAIGVRGDRGDDCRCMRCDGGGTWSGKHVVLGKESMLADM